MKKLIALIISAVMLLSFAACTVTPSPTDEPTSEPSQTTTDAPTEEPTQAPTDAPSDEPTLSPTEPPTEPTTERPTEKPTEPTTERPTEKPTEPTTERPTEKPTEPTTERPTEKPTEPTTERPTEKPTAPSTEKPTEHPTEEPTLPPTEPPTEPVTEAPTEDISALPDATRFTVSSAIGNNMVLQRDEYIKIWGFAPNDQNGSKVTVTLAGMTAYAKIENGKWMAVLPETLPASTEKLTLTVSGDDTERTFTGIMIGDVYWVVGQSNVDYSIATLNSEAKPSFNGKNIKITDADNIRLLRNSFKDRTGVSQGSTKLINNSSSKYGWQTPTQGAKAFSAIGYFFAKQILDATNNDIPIGIIEFEANGQPIAAFFPNELADKTKIDYRSKDGLYYVDCVVGTVPSRYMYNQYMYPLQNLAIAGMLWYQGESDCMPDNEVVYAEHLSALINDYRDRHDLIKHDYPVYIIEFPTNYFGYDFGSVRGQLGRAAMLTDNVYVASCSDIWTDSTYGTAHNQLHPYCKYDQAQRASAMALAVAYGKGSIDSAAGPQPVSVTINGNEAVITYKYVGKGLTTSSGISTVKGFQVYDGDKWHDSTATVSSANTVTVMSPYTFTAVRYNCIATNFFGSEVTLCSSGKIPAVAFTCGNIH
ncbi:MAG: sialate O-acetylesterase [Eubacteriales bacterium]